MKARYALLLCLVLVGCGPEQSEEDQLRAIKAKMPESVNFELPGAVDLIETREDIVYRWGRGTGTLNADRLRAIIDEVLKRDFATWPLAPGAAKGAGGILDSGGPSDTTTVKGWKR